ncbi:peptidoglycan-binding domain-containing protein [Streptomyces sp. 2A115]|uniref:peptidoglycan-binding domain-containing protein n=1 Tax=Streptomyces sp. 2A115 TaxID=3457439 RepID=UPI003FD44263
MSTPSDPEPPPRRSALEPTHVLSPRRPGALSELVRQVRERERDPDEGYEVVAIPAAEGTALPWATEDETQQLPPVVDDERDRADRSDRRDRPVGRVSAYGRTSLFRRTVIAVAAVAAALVGFSAALLLTWDRNAAESQAPPPAASSAPPARAADPDGVGTLREGDNGAEVSELQERLLRIPNVYEGGTTSGVYDATLTAAVARFQLWYGIRGDETGVYGNDTRTDLESRTAS